MPTPGASPVTSSDGSSYPRRFTARRIRSCQAERRIRRCQAHRRAAVRSTQAAGSRQEAVRRRNPDDTTVGAHATRVPARARAIRAGASHPRRRVREQTSASPTLHRRRPGEAAIVASYYPILRQLKSLPHMGRQRGESGAHQAWSGSIKTRLLHIYLI